MRHCIQSFLAATLMLLTSVAYAGASNPGLANAIKLSMPLAKQTRGNVQRFMQLTEPMAPLDLNVLITIPPEYASEYKNFYFGAMAGAAGLNDKDVKKLISDFFAKYANESKSPTIDASAKSARKLAQEIGQYKTIHIIATWNRNAFRLNDTFIAHNTITLYHCNGSYYIPCENKVSIPLSSAGEAITNQIAPVRSLAASMRRAGFVAVVKQPPDTPLGTRAIIDGVANNEVGFFVTKTPHGSVPTWFAGGKRVVFVRQILPTVFFYETN